DTVLMIFARAARSLKRAPSFTLTVVATLALGIGLATAVFTVANALLFRTLRVRDADAQQRRVRRLRGRVAGERHSGPRPRSIPPCARLGQLFRRTRGA